MAQWLDEYERFTVQVFGQRIPADLRNTKIHSVYPDGSEWFRKSVDALLLVEHEYAQELVREIWANRVPGDFVEFGIYQGAWVRSLFDMTEKVGLRDRGIWGFDSFKGLSKPHEQFDTSFWEEGMYAVSRSDVERNLDTANRPRIKLIEGFFAESLSGAEAQALRDVAYARIDCDIYEPALQCLHFLSNRLSDGAVLVFDDWTHAVDVGEARAFKEWIPTVPHLQFEFLALGPWDHLYLRVKRRG